MLKQVFSFNAFDTQLGVQLLDMYVNYNSLAPVESFPSSASLTFEDVEPELTFLLACYLAAKIMQRHDKLR